MNDVATLPAPVAHPIVEFKTQLDSRASEFQAALPAHIPHERFMRVVMTAVQNTPQLLTVERRSLFTSAMKAAQDGLLPDGREAALVIFNDKQRGSIAQYMPMIAGLRKKVRNSGEIATWDAHVVYENDAFEFELGDDPFIKHKPALVDRGKPIAAYSVATLKSGEKSREVMSMAEIDKVRAVSRAKDRGPWVDWREEMMRKTVARRHAKVLPMSTDLDDLLRRDEALYDMDGASDKAALPTPKRTLSERFDALAGQSDAPSPSNVAPADPLANLRAIAASGTNTLRDWRETAGEADVDLFDAHAAELFEIARKADAAIAQAKE